MAVIQLEVIPQIFLTKKKPGQGALFLALVIYLPQGTNPLAGLVTVKGHDLPVHLLTAPMTPRMVTLKEEAETIPLHTDHLRSLAFLREEMPALRILLLTENLLLLRPDHRQKPGDQCQHHPHKDDMCQFQAKGCLLHTLILLPIMHHILQPLLEVNSLSDRLITLRLLTTGSCEVIPKDLLLDEVFLVEYKALRHEAMLLLQGLLIGFKDRRPVIRTTDTQCNSLAFRNPTTLT